MRAVLTTPRRLGGAAVMVGAGVLLGLAIAAPAWAEPDSSGSESGGGRASSAPHRGGAAEHSDHTADLPSKPRPAATISARDVEPVAEPPIPSDDDAGPTAEPVAAVTAREPAVTVREPAVTLRETPRQDRSAIPTPAAATVLAADLAPSPAPAPPAPLTVVAPEANSILSLFGCAPPGRRITILKGTHFAIPQSWGLFIKRVYGTGTFTDNSVYDLKDEDQYDWNKFTGIAFTPLEPDRDSVMVGWRYNLATEAFEIAPFYNVDKKRILPDEQTEVISVPAGETFDYYVDYTGVTVSYGGKTVFKPYPEGLEPNVWTASRVSGWFGGNEKAPRTLSYYLKMNWW